MAKQKKESAPVSKSDSMNWTEAEKKLKAAIKRREEDGHYYNSVVKPLEEVFNAGGRNEQLYIGLMKL